MSDAWYFDTISLEWYEIKTPKPSLFKRHANFTADLYNSNIIIFGGLKSPNGNCYDDLLLFQLFDPKEYVIPEICNQCKMPFSIQASTNVKLDTTYEIELSPNKK